MSAKDEERVLGPPLAALTRAGLIVPGMPRRTVVADDTLLHFARSLPGAELTELYACTWCTQSMVQGLASAARQ